jgi:hypothetical protein
VISALWMRPLMSATYWLLDVLLVPFRFIF